MAHTYVLGHTGRELDRLDLQGLLYRDTTERCFGDAGLEAGMRVLDVGCGSGDVSRLAGRMVGSAGYVLGIDRDPGSVETARARTAAAGLQHVHFRTATAGTQLDEAPFDALVGRFILMHQDDPALMLRTLLPLLRPGAAVAFVESSAVTLRDGLQSRPDAPLYRAVVEWKIRVIASAGADTEAGLRLGEIFVEAGLPRPTLRLEARMEGGPDSPLDRYMVESVRSMAPQAAAAGLSTAPLEPLDTLEERLREEAGADGGFRVLWPTVSAWTRLPGA